VIGFIKGLFGSSNEEATPQPKDAFYLSNDDSKTFGNIDYMRSVKKTRRTFPKQAVGEDNEFIQEVSATDKVTEAQPSFTAGFTPTASSSPETAARRQDSSMDMFRNMARDMKKG
jgi:hypothetical protein